MRTNIIITYFRSKYNRSANWFSARYHAALRYAGLEDNETNRIMAGIVVSVIVWYMCVLMQVITNALQQTAQTLTALVQ